jgi:hypothetical protein
MKKILWDRENDEEAFNWDETKPKVIGNTVIIKELGCNCNPGSCCGGCVDVFKKFPIGKNHQYFWKTVD